VVCALAWFPFAITCGGPRGESAANVEPPPPAAGCYRLNAGPWRPAAGSRWRPPLLVRLDTAVRPRPAGDPRAFALAAVPASPAESLWAPKRWPRAAWRQPAPDSVAGYFSDGFGGLALLLRGHGDTLRGAAVVYGEVSDSAVATSGPSAEVTAVRVACDSLVEWRPTRS